jgi:hypothetical protein
MHADLGRKTRYVRHQDTLLRTQHSVDKNPLASLSSTHGSCLPLGVPRLPKASVMILCSAPRYRPHHFAPSIPLPASCASPSRRRDYCIGQSFAAGTGEVHHRTANSLSRLRVQEASRFLPVLAISHHDRLYLRRTLLSLPTASSHSNRSLSFCTTLAGSLGARITVSL